MNSSQPRISLDQYVCLVVQMLSYLRLDSFGEAGHMRMKPHCVLICFGGFCCVLADRIKESKTVLGICGMLFCIVLVYHCIIFLVLRKGSSIDEPLAWYTWWQRYIASLKTRV